MTITELQFTSIVLSQIVMHLNISYDFDNGWHSHALEALFISPSLDKHVLQEPK